MTRATPRASRRITKSTLPMATVAVTRQEPEKPIRFANTDLQTAFEAMRDDMERYRACLNAVSDDIRRVEAYLRDSPIRTPFVTNDAALIWHDHNDTGRWRVCVADGENCRPLIEAKATERMKLSTRLPEVMRIAGETARYAVKGTTEA